MSANTNWNGIDTTVSVSHTSIARELKKITKVRANCVEVIQEKQDFYSAIIFETVRFKADFPIQLL